MAAEAYSSAIFNVRIHNGNKRHELGLNHFLRLEKVLKSPVDKVLRISFLVFLFCKKMLASRGKSLILTLNRWDIKKDSPFLGILDMAVTEYE